MDISKRQVLKYTMLPGILPRLKHLLSSSLGNLAYLIAVVYNTVRILPKNHRYLQPNSIGQYTIREVIAEAANYIEFSRKNADQVIVFFAILIGLTMMLVQFFLLGFAVFVTSAQAALTVHPQIPATVPAFFITTNPSEDIAYRMLDFVFGVPGMFGSKEAVGQPFQLALQSIFQFYSFGMVMVGVIIIVYSIITIVGETAVSGTPFGQRFNHAWVAPRLILFFALLLPIQNGLNGGQHVVLYAAKLGSGLATTGWVVFNDALATGTYLGQTDELVATPNAPDLMHIPAFMMVVKTCDWAFGRKFNAVIEPRVVWGEGPGENAGPTTFANASTAAQGKNFKIVFGIVDPGQYFNSASGIKPTCGAIAFKPVDVADPGSAIIQEYYFNKVMCFWNNACGADYATDLFARNYAFRFMDVDPIEDNALLPTKQHKATVYNGMYAEIVQTIDDAVTAQRADAGWAVDQEIMDLGWGGAAIWYNRIAQKNGTLISAVHNAPEVEKYPDIMERVRLANLRENFNVGPDRLFAPDFRKDAPSPYSVPGEDVIGSVLNRVYMYWEEDGYRTDDLASQTTKTDNIILDTINLILGTEGLFEICKNKDIHPLAQLSAVGKSMLDRSIGSFGLAVGSGLLGLFEGKSSNVGQSFANFFSTMAGIGLLIGFILFYVLPFFPFIYFFFAVGGWIKGIFEAMVATPLWALAHLRVDGDGIPGEAAIDGYFLIFEIFIRPILIIFGLLASIAVFSAMVKILGNIFYLMTSNVSGSDARTNATCFQAPAANDISGGGLIDPAAQAGELTNGTIDEFFFTILYTILVYMIGTGCFKLIDLIPNQVLRWLNISTPTFNDGRSDPTQGLMMYVSLGGSKFSQLGNVFKGG